MSVQKHLRSSVSCLGSCLSQMWSPRLSYSIEDANPWLTFNFCVLYIIDLSVFDNRDSSFLQCLFAGWCCEASVTLLLSFLNICIYLYAFPNKQHCPHTEHINLYEFQCLAHILHIKNLPQVSILQLHTLSVLQSHSLLSSNPHSDSKVESITLLMAHNEVTVLSYLKGLPYTSDHYKMGEETFWRFLISCLFSLFSRSGC